MHKERSSTKLAKNPMTALIIEKANLPIQSKKRNRKVENDKMIGMLQTTIEARLYQLDTELLTHVPLDSSSERRGNHGDVHRQSPPRGM